MLAILDSVSSMRIPSRIRNDCMYTNKMKMKMKNIYFLHSALYSFQTVGACMVNGVDILGDTMKPTAMPSMDPTSAPSMDPTVDPTANPSEQPTADTVSPSMMPTVQPSGDPTMEPTVYPTVSPTDDPTAFPSSLSPTRSPTEVCPYFFIFIFGVMDMEWAQDLSPDVTLPDAEAVLAGLDNVAFVYIVCGLLIVFYLFTCFYIWCNERRKRATLTVNFQKGSDREQRIKYLREKNKQRRLELQQQGAFDHLQQAQAQGQYAQNGNYHNMDVHVQQNMVQNNPHIDPQLLSEGK